MKSLRIFILLFVAALFSVSSALGQTSIDYSKVEYAEAEFIVNNQTMIIRWLVKYPELFSDFVLLRSVTGVSSDFQNINGNNCTQSGNRFECEDRDLYKGSTEETAAEGSVSYKLMVTDPEGGVHEYFIVTESFTTNAVRRTWGSIKSMFQ